MSCKQYEELLPALAGGDLDADTERDVRAHVSGCDACRQSLAVFTALEQALVDRRAEVPPVDRFVPEVSRPLIRPALRRALDAVMNVPALASIGFIWLGLLMFAHRDALSGLIGRTQFLSGTSLNVKVSLDRTLAMAGGNDMTAMIVVYSVVTLAILAATGFLATHFIRSTR